MLVLLVIAIAAAIAALEVRNLFTCFAAAAVGGLAFVVAVFAMRAPGVGVLAAVVGALLVWMLLRAAGVLRAAPAGGSGLAGLVVALALLVILFMVAVRAFSGMPKLGEAAFASVAGAPAMAYGSANFMTVLFSYRLLDFLGLVALIVVAVAAWLALGVGGRESQVPGTGAGS